MRRLLSYLSIGRLFVLAVVAGLVAAGVSLALAPEPRTISQLKLERVLAAHDLLVLPNNGYSTSVGDAEADVMWSSRQVGLDQALVAYWTRSADVARRFQRVESPHQLFCPDLPLRCDRNAPAEVVRVENVILAYRTDDPRVRLDAARAVSELRGDR